MINDDLAIGWEIPERICVYRNSVKMISMSSSRFHRKHNFSAFLAASLPVKKLKYIAYLFFLSVFATRFVPACRNQVTHVFHVNTLVLILISTPQTASKIL